MKRGFAWLCRLGIILLCSVLLCSTVSAVTESASKTGVMVQLSTPKDTYKAGEEIGVRLNVVNYSMGTVTGNYTVTLPDEVVLTGKTAGEISLTGGNKQTITLGNYPETNYIFSVDDVETVAEFGDEEYAGIPVQTVPTGDSFALGLWIAVALLSGAGLVVLIVTRRKARAYVALLLCVCTLLPMLPAVEVEAAEAAPETKIVEVSKTIKVDGKEATITATVECALQTAADADPYLFKAVDGSVVLEAEDCFVDNDYFVVQTLDYASGGKAVYGARGAGYNTYEIDASNERQMGFDFVADETTQYNLWVRAYVANAHIWIYQSLNGAPYRNTSMHAYGISESKTDLIWQNIGTVRVEKGEVVEVRLRSRVTNCYIDKIMVTSNLSYIPSGADVLPPIADWYAPREFDTELYADPTVYPKTGDHPRLFFHEDDVAEIREKMYDPLNAKVTAALCETAAKNFDGVWDVTNESNYSANDLGIIESKAFYYAIYKNDSNEETRARAIKYGKQAIAAIKNCQATFTYSGNALRAKGHVLYTTALVYDWCYDLMTQKDKARLATGGQFISNGMEIGFPPIGQEAVAGHGAEKQLLRDWLSFAIAVYDEFPSVYELVGGRFFEEYVPARNKYWATAQYHHQGLSYGAYRFEADIMAQILIHKMADVEYTENPNLVYDEGISEMPYQWIYTQRPDEKFMRDGDSGVSTSLPTDYTAVMYYAAMLYKDPVLYEEFLSNLGSMTIYNYAETLTPAIVLTLQDSSVGTLERETKSLTKYFGSPYGLLTARTGWEFQNLYSNDAIVNMKIQESYLGNHQNREAGSFQIYYKGSLTGDSGFYSTVGTDHDTSYQTQSVSKNTLAITSTANPNGYQTSTQDTENPGNTGTVLGVEYGNNIYRPEYSYIAGDVAKSYDDNVEEAIRSMLFLNLNLDGYTETPGAFIVLDQIKTKEADSKKSFLLHSLAEPRVAEGNIITIENKTSGYNGRLTDQILYVGTADKADVNYTVHTIGGEDKEYWVGDMETGSNHPNTTDARPQVEAGWGRVEISTTAEAENQTDYMLNVMYVSKADSSQAVIPAKLVRGNGLMGAQILGHVALFNMNGNNRIGGTVSFEIPVSEGHEQFEVNVAGMQAGTWLVTAGDKTQEVIATEEGGMLYFTAPAGTVTLTYSAQPKLTAEGKEDTADKFDLTEPVVAAPNKMYVNEILVDVENAPYCEGDEVMVPVDTTMSTIKAMVDWRNSTIAVKYMNENELTVNAKVKTVYLNGEKIKCKLKYDQEKEELWVPLSVIQELIGEYGTAEWSKKEQMLVIDAEAGSNLEPIPETYLATYPSAIQVADAKTTGHVSNYNELEYGILSSLDGNEETRFVGSSDPTQGWQFEGVYDLGTPQTLDKLMIFFNATTDRRQYVFDVLVSVDGEEYSLVLDRARSAGENRFEAFDIPDQEVRFIKIKGYKGYMYSKKNGYTEDNFSWFSSIVEILFLGPTGDAPVEEGTEQAHAHKFKNRWNFNPASHWHDTMCGHYEISQLAYHDYSGDWDNTCDTCGRFRTPHYEHTMSEDWSFDENTHWKEATCECYGKIFEKGNHTYNDKGRCTVCGAVDVFVMSGTNITVQAEDTQLLTKPGADPLLKDAQKPAVVVEDNEAATGGKVVLMNQSHTSSMTNVSGALPHMSFRVKADKTATYYVWLKMYAATAGSSVNAMIDDDLKIDGYYWPQSASSSDLSMSGNFGDFVWVRLTKTYDWTKGSTYEVNFRLRSALVRVDEIYITTDANDPKPHIHSYSDNWSKDALNHWHAATCGCSERIKDKSGHVFTDHRDAVCDVCGYARTLCTTHTYDENNICTACGNSKPVATQGGKLVIQAEKTKLSTTPGEDLLLSDATKPVMLVQNNTAASGGKMVLVNQKYTASLDNNPGALAHSSFIVTPDVTGNYDIWLKVYAPSAETRFATYVSDESRTDSTYRRKTTGASSVYGDFSSFVWVKLENSYSWKAGEEYMVRFRGVDALLRIDEFYITNDPADPYPHMHTYTDAWSNDATYHWHEATCDCQDVTTPKEVHKFDDRTDATCNVCGYTRVLHLEHNYGADGCCTECGRIRPFHLGNTGITIQAEETNLMTEKDTTAANTTQAPVAVYEITATTGKVSADGNAVRMNIGNTTAQADGAPAHLSFDVIPEEDGQYNIWVKYYSTAATTSASRVYLKVDGVHTSWTNTRIPGTGFTLGSNAKSGWLKLSTADWKAGETYAVGLRARDITLYIDEFVVTSDASFDPTAHTHTYENEWTTDDTHHWHAADCGCTEEKKDYGVHSYTNGVCVCSKPEPNYREEEDDNGDGAIELPDYDLRG